MSSAGSNRKPDREGDGAKESDPAVAKTAGFVVFSGIAMSIIKALLPKKQPSSPPSPLRPPSMDRSIKGSETQRRPSQTIKIVKGDTLWGLSKKYGVSINAIKEANGLSGDTIYAGKILIIP